VHATRGRERLGDRRVEPGPAQLDRRGNPGPVLPLVKPRLRHVQRPARDRVRHAVAGPLVGDERGQAHRVASFTHRTTDRLRTVRMIKHHQSVGIDPA
jgi:hypothetical protein